MTRFIFSIFAAMPFASLASLHAAGVTKLRCEYLGDPIGIDVVKPRLSWVLEERGRGSEVRDPRFVE